MEQGNCLDSTLMPARHKVDVRFTEDGALDSAISGLLQAPTGAMPSQPVSAEQPRARIGDLADACIEQVARLDRWDANPVSLNEEQGNAEMERWNALFRRAVETPSVGLRDLAGKAHLMLADLDRFEPLKPNASDDARLMRVILGEAIRFGGITTSTMQQAPELGIDPGGVLPAAPDLMAWANEWSTLQVYMTATVPIENADLDEKLSRANELHGLICAYEATTVSDLAAKLPIYRDAHAELARFQAGTLDEITWRSAIRDIETLASRSVSSLQSDPALAVIEEGRRLLRAYLDAHHIYEQDPTTINPRPEWGEAGHALNDYLKGTILKTVPLTAGGCRELARFAVEYSEAIECQISDGDEEVIACLIAQSPMLDQHPNGISAPYNFALAKAEAEAIGLSALSITELTVLYDKLKAVRELWGAAMCEPLAITSRCSQGFVVRSHYGSRAEYEDARADFVMDRIAAEMGNRPAINDYERDNKLTLRIQHEIACEGRIHSLSLLADIAQAWG